MKAEFYKENRQKMYEVLPEHSFALIFSGRPIIKTADENYAFFCDRNFLYLTGMEFHDYILLAEKEKEGNVKETLFILPPDAYAERWTGRRAKEDEVRATCDMDNISYTDKFDTYFNNLLRTGHFTEGYLDLYKNSPEDRDTEAFLMARRLNRDFPGVRIHDISRQLRIQRTYKKPCEIEAMREAAKITRDGIVAMMKASHPGMYEYQYKAKWDHALEMHGCLEPAFPSIISAGANNFCIHYFDYTGMAKDGDMILNDVGAQYDHLHNDVSRGYPCNGKFTEKQRLLYNCAYNTSMYMFSIIKPGMPMKDVDLIARKYCYEQLKAIGLCNSYDDIGKYMWHGGAHHLGWDTHDLVEVEYTEPNMVFCVDIGIYCEEWGIGFRIEDNCLVTEDGCENLTAVVPKTIEDIEAIMAEAAEERKKNN